MLPDDPIFDRIMWGIVRFIFLPALLALGLALIVLLALGMVQGFR